MTDSTTPAAPAPAAPSAINTFVASMSRAELAVLIGGGLIVLIDVIFWFVDGYGLNSAFFGAGGLAALLVLARRSLPAAVSGIYSALLFALAAGVALMGARNAILDVLFIARPPGGASATFMLGFVGMLVATAAMAYAAFLMWKGRSA